MNPTEDVGTDRFGNDRSLQHASAKISDSPDLTLVVYLIRMEDSFPQDEKMLAQVLRQEMFELMWRQAEYR